MSALNFPPSLADVLQTEGGLVQDPQDPGGRTDHGVTQHVYDNWRLQAHLPTQDVALISDAELQTIYRTLYWNPVRGDRLPTGVDYAVFDFAVNSGAHRAACALQQALGVNVDGQIGDETLGAVSSADPKHVINAVCSERLAFLEKLPTFAHFGNGWTHRVNSVEVTARGMVS